MAPKRTTRRERLRKQNQVDLSPQCMKNIVAGAMEMIDLAFKQGRYQDALNGLDAVKLIHNMDGDTQAESMIDKLIKCCREQMETDMMAQHDK